MTCPRSQTITRRKNAGLLRPTVLIISLALNAFWVSPLGADSAKHPVPFMQYYSFQTSQTYLNLGKNKSEGKENSKSSDKPKFFKYIST